MSTENNAHPDLEVTGPTSRFPPATLTEPAPSGYFLMALEIDHRPPLGHFVESDRKKEAMAFLKETAETLADRGDVVDAAAFKAILTPPGRGELLRDRPDIPVARYDAVLLAEFERPDDARDFRGDDEGHNLEETADRFAEQTMTLTATNVRRIGPVDHSQDGVFMFDYVYADQLERGLAVWEHTAGWFQDQAELDNATLLQPDPGQDSAYTVINHCRWDHLRDVLRPMVFDLGFHSYVAETFRLNRTAPMPILYRLA